MCVKQPNCCRRRRHWRRNCFCCCSSIVFVHCWLMHPDLSLSVCEKLRPMKKRELLFNIKWNNKRDIRCERLWNEVREALFQRLIILNRTINKNWNAVNYVRNKYRIGNRYNGIMRQRDSTRREEVNRQRKWGCKNWMNENDPCLKLTKLLKQS